MFIAAFLCCVVPAIDPPSLELSLELAESVTSAGDIVLVKARIKNRGKERVSWRSTPSFANNDFWLEVRKRGTSGFAKCHPRTEGDDIGTGPTNLEPGKGYVAYDYLLPTNNLHMASWNNAFLLEEGIYELRVGFRMADGEARAPLYSDVVGLQVTPRSQRELEMLHSARQTLIWGVTPVDSLFSHRHDVALKALEDNLTACYLRTVLVWQRMVRECDPADPHFTVRVQAVKSVTRVVDPVTAEAVVIGLAAQLMSHKQWKLALATMEQIDEPCLMVITLRQGCRGAMEQAGSEQRVKTN